jgi:hypothetical protein
MSPTTGECVDTYSVGSLRKSEPQSLGSSVYGLMKIFEMSKEVNVVNDNTFYGICEDLSTSIVCERYSNTLY